MAAKACPRGTKKVGDRCIPKKGMEVRFLMKKGRGKYEEIYPIDSKGYAVDIGAKTLNEAVKIFKDRLEKHQLNLGRYAIGRRKVYAINWDKTKEIKIW